MDARNRIQTEQARDNGNKRHLNHSGKGGIGAKPKNRRRQTQRSKEGGCVILTGEGNGGGDGGGRVLEPSCSKSSSVRFISPKREWQKKTALTYYTVKF